MNGEKLNANNASSWLVDPAPQQVKMIGDSRPVLISSSDRLEGLSELFLPSLCHLPPSDKIPCDQISNGISTGKVA